MAGELVTIQAAATTVSTLVSASSNIIAQIRATGVARAEERERIRTALQELRRSDIAGAIVRLTRQNMEDVCFLFEYAEKLHHSPGYDHALEHARQASRLLLENLQRYTQDVR